MPLQLYNTLTRKKEVFEPLDKNDVRMYVCGPTVYDHAHIGNARPIIVFDVLFRLLRHLYGSEHVTYVRNITDVDDKINERAKSEGIAISELTERTIAQFHADIAALGVLRPTVEPRATEHIAEMIAMIEALTERGHAYAADGHVLFSVASDEDYGCLSNRNREQMLAGARVDVAKYKRDPMDFVLWKPSDDDLPGWESPWGRGRPGWHLECSAMSAKYLGKTFDIHGGGADLIFPHHENEIAQSTCAHGNQQMARYWLHNGYLQVEGEKMSKSLGNFVTINEILQYGVPALVPINNEQVSGSDITRKWNGISARLAMLGTHYRQPINWTKSRLQSASNELLRYYEQLRDIQHDVEHMRSYGDDISINATLTALSDDLNTPLAISVIRSLSKNHKILELAKSLDIMGLLDGYFIENYDILLFPRKVDIDETEIDGLIAARNAARAAKEFARADEIRDQLADKGIVLKDGPDGTTWEVSR
jgi:cysteinyl-tRNA synthetase